MSERKLASVQKILKIEPIENADAIERLTILGWQCVSKKDTFCEGQFCVYFEVDSLLPIKPEFEFLRKGCFNERLNGFRIKTIKLRGQVSQGLALPFEDVGMEWKDQKIGDDLTEALGVRKYEPEIHASLKGDVKGAFPSFIPKTDEERVQNVPDIASRHPGKTFVATEKLDGTSSTFYIKDGEFGVCGRNWELKDTEENTYWAVAKKLDIENKLRAFGSNVAIQGEIVGPSIQKNRYALNEFKLFIYHVFDIDGYKYFDHIRTKDFCHLNGFVMVPEVETNINLEDRFTTVDDLVAYSLGPSKINPNIQREGVVIKSLIEATDPELGRLSFKVINPQFLLKYEE